LVMKMIDKRHLFCYKKTRSAIRNVGSWVDSNQFPVHNKAMRRGS
jgi:hypothetical protein